MLSTHHDDDSSLFGLPSHQITAELSKPSEVSAASVLHGLHSPLLSLNNLSSHDAMVSSPFTSASEMGSSSSGASASASANDYFSVRPRSTKQRSESNDSRGWGSHSRHTSEHSAREQSQQMSLLLDDAFHMSNGTASRWRKAATTMPRSLWKPDTEATTCDFLSLSHGPCEKPFGHFLGKYRLPAVADTTFGPVTNDHAVQTPSALWGGVKTNRRNHCFRCGNCFCDSHSNKYATLIVDGEDAPEAASSEASAQQPAADDVLPFHASDANVPVRSATAYLTQYLAASAAGATSSTHTQSASKSHTAAGSRHRTRKHSTTESSSPSSMAGSFDSQGSDSWSSLSGSSNLAESLRSHGVSRSCNTQQHGSSVSDGHSLEEVSAAVAALQTSTSMATKRRREHSVEDRAQRLLSESIAAGQLADGRFIVRERVCTRCHDIVDQARSRAIEKHTARVQGAQDETALPARRSSDPTSQSQQEHDDYISSLQRLHRDYRCERKKMLQQFRSASTESVPRVASAAKLFPLAPPPQRYLRRPSQRHIGNDAEEEEDEDDDDDEACSRHYTPSRLPCHLSHFPALPGRHDIDDLHAGYGNPLATRPQAPLPSYGMGGQRLQLAFARYQ
ncbi:unnamed protein product [Parajaminaea phylloscopi]